ncbi:MAG TPA: hypothetical protein VJL36_01005 [Candidatus Paceibacterota bacterium]
MPNKLRWTLEKIQNGFERFKKEAGRFPTATEIDSCVYLPSSRQIQRRFIGGLPALRKQLKLDGPLDFTKGVYSSNRAKSINKRAHNLEREIYKYLVQRFGKMYVHREYFFTDDRRTRTDFFIYHRDGTFSVDIFYPKDRRNLSGCLNNKLRTYSNTIMLQYPVIFLMMNDNITEEEINGLLANKKQKLSSYQKVMTLRQFKNFCGNKKNVA